MSQELLKKPVFDRLQCGSGADFAPKVGEFNVNSRSDRVECLEIFCTEGYCRISGCDCPEFQTGNTYLTCVCGHHADAHTGG